MSCLTCELCIEVDSLFKLVFDVQMICLCPRDGRPTVYLDMTEKKLFEWIGYCGELPEEQVPNYITYDKRQKVNVCYNHIGLYDRYIKKSQEYVLGCIELIEAKHKNDILKVMK